MQERAEESTPKGRRRGAGRRGGQGVSAQLAPTRRRAIGSLVAEHGALTVSELAACFGVSSMTIRRDLEHLQRSGTIERAHGGAVRLANLPSASVEPSFLARRNENAAAKTRIAKAAAALIEDGEVVALDVGSSVVALAEMLRPRTDLGVVTHNLHVVAALAWAETGPSLYVLGGHCRRTEGSLCGPHAGEDLARLWLDTAVIGVAGLSPEGLFDYAPEEAEIKRQYRSRARRVVVLCDASKLGRRSLVQVAGLDAVDILVTDVIPSRALALALENASVRVVVAAPDLKTVEIAQA